MFKGDWVATQWRTIVIMVMNWCRKYDEEKQFNGGSRNENVGVVAKAREKR